MKRAALAIMVCALATGCVPVQKQPGGVEVAQAQLSDNCGQLASDQQLVVQLSEDMVAQGRLHAAFAHLEQLPDTLPEVRLRKAIILRKLGDPRAEPLYRTLMQSCLVAQAYSGLGQMAAARGEYATAKEQLEQAARLAPADFSIRNDLGFVYLHLRELAKARFEFLTALELSEDSTLPLENLLTLLIYEDHWAESSALLGQKKVTPQQYQRAEARARALKLEDMMRKQQQNGRSRSAASASQN